MTTNVLSPRISFSQDLTALNSPNIQPISDNLDLFDFEFRLDDPVDILPADELFSDGKLVPLLLTSKPPAPPAPPTPTEDDALAEALRKAACITGAADPYAFSPRAPSCTSRWRDLLGLRRALKAKRELQLSGAGDGDGEASSQNSNANHRYLKILLHRRPKLAAALDSTLSQSLIRSAEAEPAPSSSSRLSLSSSSSSSAADHDDIPRLSLDSADAKPSQAPPIMLCRNPPRANAGSKLPRAGRRPVRRATPPARGVSVDSPRMNASGKIVFEGLERSSSSPGSFSAGSRPRPRPREMERSYSATVRVTPVLNVPVCSIRGSSRSGSGFGFGQLFSPQKKDRDSSGQAQGGSVASASSTSKTKAERNAS